MCPDPDGRSHVESLLEMRAGSKQGNGIAFGYGDWLGIPAATGLWNESGSPQMQIGAAYTEMTGNVLFGVSIAITVPLSETSARGSMDRGTSDQPYDVALAGTINRQFDHKNGATLRPQLEIGVAAIGGGQSDEDELVAYVRPTLRIGHDGYTFGRGVLRPYLTIGATTMARLGPQLLDETLTEKGRATAGFSGSERIGTTTMGFDIITENGLTLRGEHRGTYSSDRSRHQANLNISLNF